MPRKDKISSVTMPGTIEDLIADLENERKERAARKPATAWCHHTDLSNPSQYEGRWLVRYGNLHHAQNTGYHPQPRNTLHIHEENWSGKTDHKAQTTAHTQGRFRHTASSATVDA
ncbi:hypothetical protein [Gluconacetobacter diazotrophicus]|uniref:Uncharacterized protein n=1 Tax=Gluconacetobacter diazotrophicus (strain ATCC 49037 / DSM 5601 / CCUG 37298 / CIP 103539 / LMG 7603 / PAl5) TaxID=272568 RepID=A9HGP2_GLUDA|nr:hypothetical protein [Gluconacetobacter diazotrophicus]CAP55529.1 hypothetical protein GDI1586 [Gluconacetobacter diazotrophicus PA1 5]